jgi:hypothetical protein
LEKLSNTPQNNFFIHTAVAGDKNSTTTLDLLSGLYGGSFLHSPTKAAFPRKLSVLTKQIQNPILHDLRITLLGNSEHVQLYHDPKLSRFLPKNHALSFIGTAEKLEEFDIFIQGRSEQGWVNIRKHIHLQEAPRGHAKLEKSLSLQKAYIEFAKSFETVPTS